MKQVIYGNSFISYHAIRTLRDTAKDAPSIHSENSFLNSFHVDNFGGSDTQVQVIGLFIDIAAALGGSDTQEQVIGLFIGIATALELGMSVRKWASNSYEFLEAISLEL